jgi:hypothetical protein
MGIVHIVGRRYRVKVYYASQIAAYPWSVAAVVEPQDPAL